MLKLDNFGRLPPGRHTCTIEQVQDIFVRQAPHGDTRSDIMSAFTGWRTALSKLIPNHVLWVNGSFVTYNSAPPNDIDVFIITSRSDVNSLDPQQQNALESLLTFVDQKQDYRSQPMGGLVDAFIGFRDSPDRTSYWFQLWQKVKGDETAKKGFLEVKSDA